MNQKERDRLSVFRRVEEGPMTLKEAADRLGVGYRQTRRAYRRYREVGDAGLAHGLRGRPGNNRRAADERRERAVALYRERYRGFGPTLAAEQLAARDALAVNHETLRGWLIAAGLWKPRRDKRRHHRRWRPRKACFGELVQLDGSDHRWFGEEHPRCTLMVMVDDATGWTHARFFESETSEAVMRTFRGWVERHGLPAKLYPDRHSIHRRNDKAADEEAHRTGVRPPTRFGRAMDDLGVELICAHSPQAKGRVERMNGTLQDRLVKLLNLEGITTIQAANEYLDQMFLAGHNARFAVAAADPADAHRPAPEAAHLDAALCFKEQRVVGNDGCVSLRGRWFQLLGSDNQPRRLKRVEVREHLDGRIELWAGDRTLRHKELAERPARPERAKPPLSERVAGHAGPYRPPADHRWRKAAVAG